MQNKWVEQSMHIGIWIIRTIIGIFFGIYGYFLLFSGQAETFLVPELTKLGLPAPIFFAYLAAGTEFFGGIALVLGLLHRLASLGLMITMGVAVWLHIFNGDSFIPDILLPLSMGFICMGLVFTGSGRWSLEKRIFQSSFWSSF